jgi:hypothetical protein
MNNFISTSVYASGLFLSLHETHELEFSVRVINGKKSYTSKVITDFSVYEISITTTSLLDDSGTANFDIVEIKEDGWKQFNLLATRHIKSRNLPQSVLFELNETLIDLGIVRDEDLLTLEFYENGARRSVTYR